MKGRLIDLAMGLNRRQRVTIELDRDFRAEFERLKDADLDVEIKKHRNRRSLSANAYAWVLIDKIAAALSIDKEKVYQEAIRNIGGVSEIVCVQDTALDKLRKSWREHGVGWQTEILPSKIPGCTNVILYFGSSTYDTKQMSLLIDHLVEEAKSLGIETMPIDELQRLIGGNQ